jgi:hypothetical protein
MQAIQTKYIGPSKTKGSRIKAWCDAGSVTIPYPHEFSGMACHLQAARALQIKMGWIGKNYGQLIGGALPGNTGYCFVLAPIVDALGNLIQWAAGNRGAKTGNDKPQSDKPLQFDANLLLKAQNAMQEYWSSDKLFMVEHKAGVGVMHNGNNQALVVVMPIREFDYTYQGLYTVEPLAVAA